MEMKYPVENLIRIDGLFYANISTWNYKSNENSQTEQHNHSMVYLTWVRGFLY